MKVVLIIPTYNERENIKQLIEKIFLATQRQASYNVEILIVDDRSPDGTAEEVKKLQKTYPKVFLITGEKKGLGMAYVRGMNYAANIVKADIMFEIDADLSHDPKLIPVFLKSIENGADFVIGSRYIPGGAIPKEWAPHRKIFSIVGNLIVRFGLFVPAIHDWTSGYRALRTSVYKTVGEGLSRYPGYTFQVAFLHRVYLAKCVITEVPLVFVDRSWGKSKIIPPDYIYNVILYVITHSALIRFIIVGGLGFLVQLLTASLLVALHIFPGIAISLGAELAIISNFILNNNWTFAHKKLSGRRKLLKRFLAFNAAGIGSIIIQGTIVSLGVIILGRSYWLIISILTIVFLIIPYSFFIYNKFIWRQEK